jgi:ribonuclease HI
MSSKFISDKSLVAIGKHVIFTWIPSHIGIHGNTVVDREAKNAMDDPVSKYWHLVKTTCSFRFLP